MTAELEKLAYRRKLRIFLCIVVVIIGFAATSSDIRGKERDETERTQLKSEIADLTNQIATIKSEQIRQGEGVDAIKSSGIVQGKPLKIQTESSLDGRETRKLTASIKKWSLTNPGLNFVFMADPSQPGAVTIANQIKTIVDEGYLGGSIGEVHETRCEANRKGIFVWGDQDFVKAFSSRLNDIGLTSTPLEDGPGGHLKRLYVRVCTAH